MAWVEEGLRVIETAARPPRLPGADVGYTVHEAAVGRLVLAVGLGAVLVCSYDDEETVVLRLARTVPARVVRDPARCDQLRRQLDEYLAGGRRNFDLVVDPVLATPFTRRTLEALSRVPYGATSSYASIAREIGSPTAARAVGNALGANPLCILLPCHRVVRSNGALGGYAGGAAAKQMLLGIEQRFSKQADRACTPQVVMG